MNSRISVSLIAILMISLTVPAFTFAQPGPPQGGRGRMMMQWDPVEALNRALQSAGAPQLSANQQQELNSLVEAHKTATSQEAPDQAMLAARDELHKAILSRDEGAVSAAADRMSSEICSRTGKAIREMGTFKIRVLGILTEDQISALKTQYGETGLLHMLGAPAGGWFKGFGHGRMHR